MAWGSNALEHRCEARRCEQRYGPLRDLEQIVALRWDVLWGAGLRWTRFCPSGARSLWVLSVGALTRREYRAQARARKTQMMADREMSEKACLRPGSSGGYRGGSSGPSKMKRCRLPLWGGGARSCRLSCPIGD